MRTMIWECHCFFGCPKNMMRIMSMVILWQRLTVNDSMIPNRNLLLSACIGYNQSTSFIHISSAAQSTGLDGSDAFFIYFRPKSYLMWGVRGKKIQPPDIQTPCDLLRQTNMRLIIVLCHTTNMRWILMLCMLWAWVLYLEYTWQPSPPLSTNTTFHLFILFLSNWLFQLPSLGSFSWSGSKALSNTR